jgi:hypothetical protein
VTTASLRATCRHEEHDGTKANGTENPALRALRGFVIFVQREAQSSMQTGDGNQIPFKRPP